MGRLALAEILVQINMMQLQANHYQVLYLIQTTFIKQEQPELMEKGILIFLKWRFCSLNQNQF